MGNTVIGRGSEGHVSIVAAFILFGETLTAVQLIGGIMVMAGIWVMQWSDTRTRATGS